jgi:uracil-DNA glycosylase
MKSLRRLQIDPLAVYGTLFVKCPVADSSLADPSCLARVAEEIAIVSPKIIVVMGADALEALNDLSLPLATELEMIEGSIQELTSEMSALVVPNVDLSLDEEQTKRDFWSAFRVLGDWYSALPPY